MNSRLLVILSVVVAAIVAAAIWFLQPDPAPKAAVAPAGTPVPSAVPAPAAPAPARTVASQGPTPVPKTAAPKAAPVEPKPLEEWEMKIDQALRMNAGETETAQMLINMLPTLPAEGQAEAAQHISNLIVDKDYNRVMPLLKNTALPEEVQDVLVTDLMNRDDAVKLPALLEVAKLPNHPYHDEALTDLQIFLDADHGTDWNKWDASVKGYLKKQAEENAEADAPSATPLQPAAPKR